MSGPLASLQAQRRQARCPAERAAIASVIDDVHIVAGLPPTSRRVRGLAAAAYAYAAAYADYAAAAAAAADAAYADAAYAYAYAYAAAYADYAAAAAAAADAAYADAAAAQPPTEWIDMTPGIYLIQWRGTYDRAVTAIAHCRVDGDWVLVAPGHRTMWTSGTRPLTSVAVTGPGDDHTLGEPSEVPRWLPVGAVSAIGPLSADVWGKHIGGAK